MDLHLWLQILSGVLALGLFWPLLRGVFRDGGVGQSFATWLLWAALDTTATISLMLEHGNYFIVLGFAIGGVGMTLALLYRRRFGWNRFDTAILILVLACLAAWKAGGPKTATVAATLAIVVAGIPALLALWREPNRRLGNLWGWYVLANGLAFLGGRAMTVEERFAPGVFALQSLLMFAASRWSVGEKRPLAEPPK
jgi:hypothetical protein